jgi:hypothetical protein
MGDVKRYDMKGSGTLGEWQEPTETEGGGWVRAEDYDAALVEQERLRGKAFEDATRGEFAPERVTHMRDEIARDDGVGRLFKYEVIAALDAIESLTIQRDQGRRSATDYRDKYEPTKRLAWEDGI